MEYENILVKTGDDHGEIVKPAKTVNAFTTAMAGELERAYGVR